MSAQTLTEEKPAAQERVEYATPAVDLYRNGEEYTLELDLPGVSREDVSITFEEGKLTVTGHRRPVEVPGKLVHRESRERGFRRVFNVDPSIDSQKISATIEQGVLRIGLTKSEASRPRKIAVG